MPILSRVGRRSLSVRVVVAAMYLLLSAGAVTMLYPFFLMLSTSITSPIDVEQYQIIPRYVRDQRWLFAKYLEDKYEKISELNDCYGTAYTKFEEMAEDPATSALLADTTSYDAVLRDWSAFVRSLPDFYTVCNFNQLWLTGRTLRRYREHVQQRFGGEISRYNAAYQEEQLSFQGVRFPYERPLARDWVPEDAPKYRDFLTFKRTLPPPYTRVVPGPPKYQSWLAARYNREIEPLNQAWGTAYQSFAEIDLPVVRPAGAEGEDWGRFVRTRWPYRFFEATGAEHAYRGFLQDRYAAIDALNREYGTAYVSWDAVPLPDLAWLHGRMLVDWADFVARLLPVDAIRLQPAEALYRDFLRQRYSTVAAVNLAYKSAYKSFDRIPLPYRLVDRRDFLDERQAVRWDFLIRNYWEVIDYIVVHGNAVRNTVLLILGTILTQLTINPLCAYALSRYRLRATNKVLLFCLATMAFPPEVAMIPNFLLIRDLHLLNTFAALILPGVANGYWIFLLKGFFDTLPREIYEAAQLDNCGEFRMFWQITLPLIKPVMAVIALQSFVLAYGSFLWAFIVCQNDRMWTLMVWLYEMHLWAPKFVLVAALTLAAVPTLLLFIFCQRVILRGIVLPTLH